MDVAELLDIEEAYLPKNLGPRPATDSIKIYLRKDGLWSPGVEMQQTFKMLKMEEVELSMDQVGMIPFRMALSHYHSHSLYVLLLVVVIRTMYGDKYWQESSVMQPL